MRSDWALPSNPPAALAASSSARLAGVAERRVPEVVRQAGGLDEVGVAAERLAELAPDLADLDGVGQAGPREVVVPRVDDLGLGREPAQGRGVQDPGAVALEGAYGPARLGARRPSAPARTRRSPRPRRSP